MGLPPQSSEILSGQYEYTMEAFNDAQRMLYRARQADHQYYTNVQKAVKMTARYLSYSEELRERMLAVAMKEAEQCRQRDRKTWKHKAALLGFSPDTNGEWDFGRICSSMSMATICEKKVQEEEFLCKGNPSLNAIMGCLSELGSTLNRSELKTIEQKVQDLLQANEVRNELFAFASPIKTPAIDKFLASITKSIPPSPPVEYSNKKRKRHSICDSSESGDEALDKLAINNKDTNVGDGFGSKFIPKGYHEVSQLPSPVPKTCIATSISSKRQPQESVGRILHKMTPNAEQPLQEIQNHKINPDAEQQQQQQQQREIKNPESSKLAGETSTGETAIRIEKKVKLESGGVASLESKPFRTGFFDGVQW